MSGKRPVLPCPSLHSAVSSRTTILSLRPFFTDICATSISVTYVNIGSMSSSCMRFGELELELELGCPRIADKIATGLVWRHGGCLQDRAVNDVPQCVISRPLCYPWVA